jgi:hypothetical protein
MKIQVVFRVVTPCVDISYHIITRRRSPEDRDTCPVADRDSSLYLIVIICFQAKTVDFQILPFTEFMNCVHTV